MKDGFTLAIGGLIDDEDIKNTQQVPILGDIPILGNLFKSTDTTHQRDNLLIFVTARTLPTEGAGIGDTADPQLLLRSGVTADEIPGYYNAKRSADTPGMTYPVGGRNRPDATSAKVARPGRRPQTNAEFSGRGIDRPGYHPQRVGSGQAQYHHPDAALMDRRGPGVGTRPHTAPCQIAAKAFP